MNILNKTLKLELNNIINKNINGVKDGLKSNIIASLNESAVIVCSNKKNADKLIKDLKFYSNLEVLFYPKREIKYYNISAESKEIENARMNVISKIINKEKCIIVTTIEAIMQRVMPIDSYDLSNLEFNIDSKVDLNNSILKLNKLGYERCSVISGKGQYAIRGGIIDIYGLNMDNPYRIELFGDDIDSIREFDVISQRSIEKVDKISFSFVKEFEFNKEKINQVIDYLNNNLSKFNDELKNNILTDINLLEMNEYEDVIDKYFNLFLNEEITFLDYLKDYLVIFDEFERVEERSKNILYENYETLKILGERNTIHIPFCNNLIDFNDIKKRLDNTKNIYFNSNVDKEIINLDCKEYYFSYKNIELLVNDLNSRKDNIIVLVFNSDSRITSVVNYLKDKDISVKNVTSLDDVKKQGIYIIKGNISNGYEYKNITVITEEMLYTNNKKVKTTGEIINSFEDLKIGDYIIHENHGIGIYKGIKEVTSLNNTSEYIQLEYKDASSIYIPMSNLDKIKKYIVDDNVIPKINKLGSKEWQRTKAKAKKHIDEIASELVELYAKRDNEVGYAFSKDSSLNKEFEDEVDFELTSDQEVSIKEIKELMEDTKPMDMLLCGDVRIW